MTDVGYRYGVCRALYYVQKSQDGATKQRLKAAEEILVDLLAEMDRRGAAQADVNRVSTTSSGGGMASESRHSTAIAGEPAERTNDGSLGENEGPLAKDSLLRTDAPPPVGSDCYPWRPCSEACRRGYQGQFHPDTPKNPTSYELHLECRVGELEAEVERLLAELGNHEAVMVAADRLWTAYQAMLDGEDVGQLPDWEQTTAEGFSAEREDAR